LELISYQPMPLPMKYGLPDSFRTLTLVFILFLASMSGGYSQSFVSLGFGAGFPAGQPSQFYDYDEFSRSRSAFNFNLEAAFFSNPYFGFGGSFLISNNNSFMRGMLGPYLSIPFGEKLVVQGKSTFGWLNGAHCPGIGFLTLSGGSGNAGYDFCIPITGYAVGASIRHMLNDYLAIGISFDYTSEFSGQVPDDPTLIEYLPVRYFYTGLEISYVIY